MQAEDETGKPMPLIPQTRFNSAVRLEFDGKGKIIFNNFSVQHLYFLKQDRVVAYESASKAYQLINLGANLTIQSKNPLFIKIGVQNILMKSTSIIYRV